MKSNWLILQKKTYEDHTNLTMNQTDNCYEMAENLKKNSEIIATH